MQLFIKTPDGKTEILNVNLSLSVENITHLIEDKMFVPTFFQRLYSQGKCLNHNDYVEDLGIKDGDTLELNYDILSGGKNASRFKKASSFLYTSRTKPTFSPFGCSKFINVIHQNYLKRFQCIRAYLN